MKLNTTDFSRKLQHPLLMALASVPVALIIMLNAAPEALARMWCLPAAYVLLSWACILIPGKKRILAGVVSAALIAGLAFAVLPLTQTLVLFLLPVIYIALLIMALPIGGWERNHELNVGVHVGGVLTHVLLQLLVNGSQMLGNGVYDPAQMPLLASFLAYVVLVLLALNRTSLDSAAQSRRRVPILMRRQNIVITLALLVIGVLIAAIPAIGSLIGTVWDMLVRFVAWIAALIMSILPQKSGGTGGGAAPADMDLGLGEVNEPSQLALIMEKVIGVLALVVLIVGAFFLLRALGKKLWQLIRCLWGRLGQYGAAAGEDYEDEITDTRDESDVEREGLLNRLRRVAAADDKGLTPAQQVRSRYRRMKRKRKWSGASTARETLPLEAASLYERARYSDQPLSEEDAERFREGTKKV